MSAINSLRTGLLPPVCRDLRRHSHLNRSRCQCSTVSGCRVSKACFQWGSLLASHSIKMRSLAVKRGRLTCRLRTINCERRKTFSRTNSPMSIIDQFFFQCSHEAFCQTILSGVASISHADANMVLVQQVGVVEGRVLHALVRMMNAGHSVLECHSQARQGECFGQITSQGPATHST